MWSTLMKPKGKKKPTDDESAEPKHIGFKGAQEEIVEGEGVPMKNAGAILSDAGRNASPAAKRKNHRLARIKG